MGMKKTYKSKYVRLYGCTLKEIAARLNCSVATVQLYLKNKYQRAALIRDLDLKPLKT